MSGLILSLPLLTAAVADPPEMLVYCPPQVQAAAALSPPPPPADAAPVQAADPAAPPTDSAAIVVTTGPLSPNPAAAAAAPVSEGAPDEIMVTGRAPSAADPAEKLNLASYEAVQAVDEKVIEPVTSAYHSRIPEPVRDGVHNFLGNLDEPVVFVNFLLQAKPGKAVETLGRFVINTTLGLGGLFDVARKKPFNLPRRYNGFGNTLAYYGVGPGPYLFLPLIGPTSLRDLIARPLDLAILPTAVPKPFAKWQFALPKATLGALDERDRLDSKLTLMRQSLDPYLTQREEYLARRRAEVEVLKGKRTSLADPPYFTMRGAPDLCQQLYNTASPLLTAVPPPPIARPAKN